MQKVRKDMAEEILKTSGKIWSIWPVTRILFENFGENKRSNIEACAESFKQSRIHQIFPKFYFCNAHSSIQYG